MAYPHHYAPATGSISIHQEDKARRLFVVNATPLPTLAAFLHRDIHQQGRQPILLPFLAPVDRLHLSECSQSLIAYRHHLSRVKLVKHPSPTPSNTSGLEQLLAHQQGLEYLHLSHESTLSVLRLAAPGGCSNGLKTLNLRSFNGEKVGGAGSYVTRALEGGGLPGLEELGLGECILGDVAFKEALGLLKTGACPQLRRLDVAMSCCEEGFGQAMAEALESGHLHNLEELNLGGNSMSHGGGAAVARALQRGACPHLIKLRWSFWGLLDRDGEEDEKRAMADIVRVSSLMKLEELDLSLSGWFQVGIPSSISHHVLVAFFEAMEAGSYPSLKQLSLVYARMSVELATAFGQALQSGNCHRLQELDLYRAFGSSPASLCFLKAIEQGGRGALPNLVNLTLISTGMGHEHGRVLGKALGEGLLPQLQKLLLGVNNLGDDGVVSTTAGLKSRGGRPSKKVKPQQVRMGPSGRPCRRE